MPQTPHIERHFASSDTIRDIVIGMSDGLVLCEYPKKLGVELIRTGRCVHP